MTMRKIPKQSAQYGLMTNSFDVSSISGRKEYLNYLPALHLEQTLYPLLRYEESSEAEISFLFSEDVLIA